MHADWPDTSLGQADRLALRRRWIGGSLALSLVLAGIPLLQWSAMLGAPTSDRAGAVTTGRGLVMPLPSHQLANRATGQPTNQDQTQRLERQANPRVDPADGETKNMERQPIELVPHPDVQPTPTLVAWPSQAVPDEPLRVAVATPEEKPEKPLILQTLDGQELKVSLQKISQPVDLFHSDQEYLNATRLVAARQQPARAPIIDPTTQLKIGRLQAGLKRARVIAQKHPEKLETVLRIKEELARLNSQVSQSQREPALEPIRQIAPRRDDLEGLPWMLGEECRMDDNAGRSMHEISGLMARAPGRFDLFGGVDLSASRYPSATVIRKSLERCHELKDPVQAMSTMDQVLQVDYPALRMELIDALQKLGTEEALERIASRAKFDLVSGVRQHAADALKHFPIESVREHLLEGLRYPWPEVALHSAEALVRLDDRGAVPQLVSLSKSPDPRLPVKQNNGRYVVRELVSINHMRNCLMCHAPSESPGDYGRAATPSILEPPPQQYYQPSQSVQGFVLADITYLKQDFSVQQSVDRPGPWPKIQRFDYLVRQRSMGTRERNEIEAQIVSDPNPYQQAIEFAMQSLTDRKPVAKDDLVWQPAPAARR